MLITCIDDRRTSDNATHAITLSHVRIPKLKGIEDMDINQARIMHGRFVTAMREHGNKERGIVDTEWLIDHLLNKIEEVGIEDVVPRSLRDAALHYMGTDVMDRAETKTQATIKTAVSMYWAFCVTGEIVFKTTIYPTGVPDEFKGVFMGFCDFIGGRAVPSRSAQVKTNLMKQYLCYLHDRCGVADTHGIEIEHAHGFVRWYFLSRRSGVRDSGRMAIVLDWLNTAGHTDFGSAEAFPYGYGRSMGGKTIPAYYTRDEVARLFAAVDRSTRTGKRDYLVMCLLAIYGMRIGDVLDLKVTDIDWEAGRIAKTQCKTGRPLSLPLVEETRDAFVDYFDGARPKTTDPHVFVRLIAPFVGYSTTSPFTKMVAAYMAKACVDPHGRRHGTHALRHSMAGGMISEGATVEQVADVLGHSTSRSTQVYLSFDAKVMGRLGLEVPDVRL